MRSKCSRSHSSPDLITMTARNVVPSTRSRPRHGGVNRAVAAAATPKPPAERPASSSPAKVAAQVQALSANGHSSNAGTTTPAEWVTTKATAARSEPTRRSYTPRPTASMVPTKK